MLDSLAVDFSRSCQDQNLLACVDQLIGLMLLLDVRSQVLGILEARIGQSTRLTARDVLRLLHTLRNDGQKDLAWLDVDVLEVEGDLGGQVSIAIASDHFLTHIDQLDVADLIVVLMVIHSLNLSIKNIILKIHGCLTS